MTSKCTYCTTILCAGCKEKYKPFFTGYRPQFYFRTTNADGTINLPK